MANHLSGDAWAFGTTGSGSRTVPRRRLYAFMVLSLTTILMLSSVGIAMADEAEGDIAGPDTTQASVIAGSGSFSFTADLFLQRQGTAASGVTWSGPTYTGSCDDVTGTSNPTGFSLPSTWQAAINGTLSFDHVSTAKSSVTVSGVAGTAGTSCILRYQGTATGQYGTGNPLPSGQRNVDITVNFVAPVIANQSPVVSTAAIDASGNEGSELSTSGAFSDPDNDSLAITKFSGVGTVTDNGDGTWSWSYTPNDNGSGTVVVEASDGSLNAQDSFEWNAANVPPTVSISPTVASGLTGVPANFTGTATDPSSVDQAAGFWWKFDGAAYTSSKLSSPQSFSVTPVSCGSQSVTVQAKDKDGGESNVATASLSVSDANFRPPLTAGAYNLVQKGQVVPVKVFVGCNGIPLAGLAPSIVLLNGDKDDNTDPGDLNAIVTESVSGADTTGFMRAADGQYIYNLRVPNGTQGTKFTIRIRPFGNGPSIDAVIQIRK